MECGVRHGGAVMAMALSLINKGTLNREIYLYDTFYGMSNPETVDVNIHGTTADDYLSAYEKSEDSIAWAVAPKDKVKKIFTILVIQKKNSN